MQCSAGIERRSWRWAERGKSRLCEIQLHEAKGSLEWWEIQNEKSAVELYFSLQTRPDQTLTRPDQTSDHAAWRIRNTRERWHWADPGESSYKAGEQWLDAGIHHVKVKYKYSEITIQTTFNGFSLGMVLHCLPYTEKFRILIVLFSWLFRSLFECWCRKNFSLLLFPRMLTKWFLAAFYQNHLKWQILSAVNKKHRLLKQDKTFSWLMQ